MNPFQFDFAEQWLFPGMVVFLFVGSLFAAIIGAGLMLRSESMFRFFGVMNRWVSTRRMLGPVETPRSFEEVLHRQRRIVGAAFVVAAGLSLIVLARTFDAGAIVQGLQTRMEPVVVELVARAAMWVLVAGDVLAIAVGIGMIGFPEALSRLEARANHWYSARQHDRSMDSMRTGLDRWVAGYPRAAGLCIVVLSVVVVVNLGAVILSRH